MNGTGLFGQHTGTAGTTPAVRGETASTAAAATAVYGRVSSASAGSGSKGVAGINNGTGFTVIGVYGSASGQGTGVEGRSPTGFAVQGLSTDGAGVLGESTTAYGIGGISSSGDGVYGASDSGNAGSFDGHVGIIGGLSVVGGCTGCAGASLMIDDPLDPAHRYLQHSSVASSQQLDIYSGNVTTNAKGFATVQMPRWFQALNRSFRYQLTAVGRAHWEAKAAVWNEMRHNRFTIRTDQPKVKVSWLVTGIRQDRYANANPTQVIVPKPKAEQGKYVHPELFGKPKSDAIGYRKPPTLPRRVAGKP